MGVPQNKFYSLSRLDGTNIKERIILPFVYDRGQVKFLFVLYGSRVCDISIIENWPEVLRVDLQNREVIGCDDTTFRPRGEQIQPSQIMALVPVHVSTPLDAQVKWLWFSEKTLVSFVTGQRRGMSPKVKKFLRGVDYQTLIRAARVLPP